MHRDYRAGSASATPAGSAQLHALPCEPRSDRLRWRLVDEPDRARSLRETRPTPTFFFSAEPILKSPVLTPGRMDLQHQAKAVVQPPNLCPRFHSAECRIRQRNPGSSAHFGGNESRRRVGDPQYSPQTGVVATGRRWVSCATKNPAEPSPAGLSGRTLLLLRIRLVERRRIELPTFALRM
jgi:hypothetical protein